MTQQLENIAPTRAGRHRPAPTRPAPSGQAPHPTREHAAAFAAIQPPSDPTLNRFDDTVALPTDTPQRLDEVVRALGRALRRMPPIAQLSHRSLARQAQLQRVAREAAQARARLMAGTYGICTECHGPISLSALREKPWTPRCVYCALDI